MLISCNKKDNNSQNDKQGSSFESVFKQNNKSQIDREQESLSVKKLMNSKWIIGEVGMNGEQPDTIIFNKSDSLLYISTDTGGEECRYFISNDTLIFINHTISYDYQRKIDINERRSNKLILSDEKLCYVETIVEVSNSKKQLT